MRTRALFVALALFASAACSKSTPTVGPAAAPSASATPKSETTNAFGAPISDKTPFIELDDLLKDPKGFDGRRIRTRGEVVAVCQNAGCWADLRPVGESDNVTVPTHVTMHQHAFFLPKNAKSKVAEIEGIVSVRTLTQDECDHYNSEGASLVAGEPVLGVDATGVVLR